MDNASFVRVKGKPKTPYEGKKGTATKMRLYDISGKRLPLTRDTPILVLWNGEKEKEPVSLVDLEILE